MKIKVLYAYPYSTPSFKEIKYVKAKNLFYRKSFSANFVKD